MSNKTLLRKAMSDYNYVNFTSNHFDLLNFEGPAVGQKAQNGRVEKTDGSAQDLLDFQGEFFVLETGSITCPLFQTRRKKMSGLVAQFPKVEFAILYIREAHPGKEIPSHQSLDEKTACALRLEHEDGEQRNIYIDDLAGTLHSAYGGFPNAIFIMNKNHCVVFRSEWNDPNAVERALEQLLQGKPAKNKSMFWPAYPPLAFSTLKRGGKGSTWDFLKSLPSLIWNNFVIRNIKVLFNKSVSAEVNC